MRTSIAVLTCAVGSALCLFGGNLRAATSEVRLQKQVVPEIVLTKASTSEVRLEFVAGADSRRVVIGREALRSRLVNLLKIETWYFESAIEEEKFRSFPNPRGLTVAKAIARRFQDRRDALTNTVSAFEAAHRKVAWKPLIAKLNDSIAGRTSILEVNRAVEREVDALLRLSAPARFRSGGSVLFRILNSYFLRLKPIELRAMAGSGGELMRTGVRQSLWFELMGTNSSFFARREYCPKDYARVDGVELCPNHPVESVSIFAITEFIAMLNYHSKPMRFRLPTLAERNLAAGLLPASFEKKIWYVANSDMQTHEVCSKGADGEDLCDLRGNLFELTQDRDDLGQFLTAGGSWLNRSRAISNAVLYPIGRDWTPYDVGFRLLRTRAD